LPQNETAAFIFTLIKNQWIIAGADGMPVDLDVSTIIDVMNMYEVIDPQNTLIKVLSAGRKYIDDIREKAKR